MLMCDGEEEGYLCATTISQLQIHTTAPLSFLSHNIHKPLTQFLETANT